MLCVCVGGGGGRMECVGEYHEGQMLTFARFKTMTSYSSTHICIT